MKYVIAISLIACAGVAHAQDCKNGQCRIPGTRIVQGAVEMTTATAQGVANIMARDGRMRHMGGNPYSYEGIGMAGSPEQALRSCCYSSSGMPVADQGVAYGHGRWWACRRYTRR